MGDWSPALPSVAALYGETVSTARRLYLVAGGGVKKSAELPWPENVVRKIILHLQSGGQDLLMFTERMTADHYLYGHVANVVILSLSLGVAMGLPEEDLVTLGLGAYLHDLGLVNHLELTARADDLTPNDFSTLRGYVEEGAKILDFFPIPEGPIKNTIRRTMLECHERAACQGSPDSLTSEQIHPHAKTVGLVGTYEAMSHSRPWRERTLPHRAVVSLLERPESPFDENLMRAMVGRLSFYPVGSWVRLSTGEIGRVVGCCVGVPLRPCVRVLFDNQGQVFSKPVLINLISRPDVFITDPVDETRLKISNRRWRAVLRARRWWLKD